MDKKIMIENPALEAHEKGVLNGAWLCAENGEIVSKVAIGRSNPDSSIPLADNVFTFKTFTDEIVFEEGGLILWEELHKKL
jgi:hypothetical protein